jgi:predicted secreted acid phosphatase
VKDELKHLEVSNGKLQNLAVEGRGLVLEQAALDARKQEVTKRLKQMLREGDTLTDFLRTGIRQHYGYQSETLVEFGIQPLRPENRLKKSRKSRKPTEPPAPATAAPTDSSPDATK